MKHASSFEVSQPPLTQNGTNGYHPQEKDVFQKLPDMFGKDVAEIKEFALDHIDELVQLNRADQSRFYERLYTLDVPKGWVARELRPAVNEAVREERNNKASEQRVTEFHLSPSSYRQLFEELGYEFRLNLLNDSIEVNDEPISSRIESRIFYALADRGLRNRELARDTMMVMADDNAYHPVKEYLENLIWDGQNHIAKLASHFKDAHESIKYQGGEASVFHIWLRRWLIGAVAKVYDPSAHQNPVLVLDGLQGKGKSYFAKWICPLIKLHFEGAIRPEDKDYLFYLANKWVWEVGELGGTMRRSDREFLKAFITQQDITARPPYGRYAITKPAMASFIGTVNNETGILSDPTGHRRFRPVTLTSINWAYSQNIDVNQLWAQAYQLYQDGESWRLSPEEERVHAEICEQFETEDPLESYVYNLFDIDPENEEWFMSSMQIATVIESQYKANTKAIQTMMGPTLKRMGLRTDRKYKVGRGYYGVMVKPEAIKQVIDEKKRATLANLPTYQPLP